MVVAFKSRLDVDGYAGYGGRWIMYRHIIVGLSIISAYSLWPKGPIPVFTIPYVILWTESEVLSQSL